MFFFNDTATTEIYTYVHTLYLHDALPILLIGLNLETRIANQAADYVDRDGEVQQSGAEDVAYAAMRPPARSANRPFTDISELKRLPAVDGRVYAALAPYVCAAQTRPSTAGRDRKSTRLNCSH